MNKMSRRSFPFALAASAVVLKSIASGNIAVNAQETTSTPYPALDGLPAPTELERQELEKTRPWGFYVEPDAAAEIAINQEAVHIWWEFLHTSGIMQKALTWGGVPEERIYYPGASGAFGQTVGLLPVNIHVTTQNLPLYLKGTSLTEGAFGLTGAIGAVDGDPTTYISQTEVYQPSNRDIGYSLLIVLETRVVIELDQDGNSMINSSSERTIPHELVHVFTSGLNSDFGRIVNGVRVQSWAKMEAVGSGISLAHTFATTGKSYNEYLEWTAGRPLITSASDPTDQSGYYVVEEEDFEALKTLQLQFLQYIG